MRTILVATVLLAVAAGCGPAMPGSPRPHGPAPTSSEPARHAAAVQPAEEPPSAPESPAATEEVAPAHDPEPICPEGYFLACEANSDSCACVERQPTEPTSATKPAPVAPAPKPAEEPEPAAGETEAAADDDNARYESIVSTLMKAAEAQAKKECPLARGSWNVLVKIGSNGDIAQVIATAPGADYDAKQCVAMYFYRMRLPKPEAPHLRGCQFEIP